MFPIQTEGPHSAEFILSEASGNRSRGNGFIADPATVKVGQPLKKIAAATTDRGAVYAVALTGADCQALSIYAAVSSSGNDLRIAVLERDSEVNGRLINWGAMSTAEQIVGATTLAANGIIVRV
jgi:hypothetical protein